VKTAARPPLVETAACCPSVLDAPLSTAKATELARGFAALAYSARLQILSILAAAPAGEVCVCDFVEPLGKSQPTVSHHLKVLGDAGLVEGDRRGKWVWYRLVAEQLAALQAAIATR
jgi:ArsR family transcriptional regulator, arsenate/arsenite/antimonite-responsive transcriptional repressor